MHTIDVFFVFVCSLSAAVAKVGVEPQVRRIGEFKSFGDTYARDSMSAAQREVTESLLSAVSDFTIGLLARDAGKTLADVEALYNSDVSFLFCFLIDNLTIYSVPGRALVGWLPKPGTGGSQFVL